jgi:uncharacterized protein with HEPN domain
MPPESRKLLYDALEAVKCVEEFTQHRQFEDFGKDKLLRAGVYFELMIVGEALGKLRKLGQGTFERITNCWRIVGFQLLAE